jgi:hypothetical protein
MHMHAYPQDTRDAPQPLQLAHRTHARAPSQCLDYRCLAYVLHRVPTARALHIELQIAYLI